MVFECHMLRKLYIKLRIHLKMFEVVSLQSEVINIWGENKTLEYP